MANRIIDISRRIELTGATSSLISNNENGKKNLNDLFNEIKLEQARDNKRIQDIELYPNSLTHEETERFRRIELANAMALTSMHYSIPPEDIRIFSFDDHLTELEYNPLDEKRIKDHKKKQRSSLIYKLISKPNPNFKAWCKLSPQIVKRVVTFDPHINRKGFYLYGHSGWGKSVLLKALAIHLQKRYGGVIYINLGRTFEAITEDDFALKSYITRKIENCVFLFIDDFGTENRNSCWVQSLVYNLLDSRIHSVTKDGSLKFTFFSSNCSSEEIYAKYHSRDMRRIADMAELLGENPSSVNAGSRG